MTGTQPLSEQSDLRSFTSLLRRQMLTILFCGLLTAGATLAVSLTQPKQYSSSARVLYTDPGTVAGSIGGGDPSRAVDTFTRLATTDDVLVPVATAMHLESTDAVRADVTVTGAANANLLDVTAVAPTASGSAALANRVASSLIKWRRTNREDQFRARITFLSQQLKTFAGTTSPSQVAAASDLRTQLTEAKAQLSVPNPELTLVSPAAIPSAPFAPKPARNAIIGFIAGLLLGFAIGAIRDRLDRKLHDTDDIEKAYPWPLLGSVPNISGPHGRAYRLADFAGMSPLADAFRNIRTNLSLLSRDLGGPQVWAISSAMPAEGKSAATANLAGAFAATGMHVLVISADLHSPGLHEYFGTPERSPGLADVLLGEADFDDAASNFKLPRGGAGDTGQVDVIANGRTFSDPALLFESDAMAELLASARGVYDAVVIDAPPLLYTAEASLLARLSDGLILVARLEHLTRHQADRARRGLETLNLAPVGVIATGVTSADTAYGTGYDYRQVPQEESTRATRRAARQA